jgi:hypothetical protein
MKKIYLAILLLPLSTFASSKLKNTYDSSCAKINLAAIYGGEKSYYSEYNAYAGSFKEIGYEYTQGSGCDDWRFDVRLVGDGQQFIATAAHPNGARWTINEKKEMVNEVERRASF